jgi:hypothetical protein
MKNFMTFGANFIGFGLHSRSLGGKIEGRKAWTGLEPAHAIFVLN